MNAIDYATQLEKQSEDSYRELAAKANNEGLIIILSMLAEEESKHAAVFANMQSNNIAPSPSAVLTQAQNIFTEMKISGVTIADETSRLDLYTQVLATEVKNQEHFEAMSQETEGVESSIYRYLTKEKEKHIELVQHIIDFINAPERYLADARFTSLKD